MSKILIGKSGSRNVDLDLDELIAGRLLIQANSGGGKSWLLRRLAEQIFGKLPIIIIDPEGEFATLREKFDFLLVGEGGDIPAHERSAALLAETLLKLKACAVIDLFETYRTNPIGRDLWVKAFLTGLLNAPKSLRHPTALIIDEAHMFCPEQGESPAEGAMVGAATAGRKRGIAAIWATQRLALLNKSASSQLQNRMVGLTFEDVDVKRAVNLLSVVSDEQHAFKAKVKVLEPGQFFAFGRAISKTRVLVSVGPVETSHPKVGRFSRSAEAPPAPEKIKALLPKLADLPKTAEEKAKNEAELRRQIRELKAALRAQPKAPAQKPQPVIVDSRLIQRAKKETALAFEKQLNTLRGIARDLFKTAQFVARQAGDAAAKAIPALHQFDIDYSHLVDELKKAQRVSGGEIQKEGRGVPVLANTETQAKSSDPRPEASRAESNGNSELTPYQRSMLDALAALELIGKTEPSWPLVGAAAGKSSASSTFEKYAARLRSAGLIDYPQTNRMRLTEEGRSHARANSVPIGPEEVQERALNLLTPYKADILRALIAAYPEVLSIEELGARAGKSHGSSTFEKYMASLGSMEMIERPRPKQAKAADWLFLE